MRTATCFALCVVLLGCASEHGPDTGAASVDDFSRLIAKGSNRDIGNGTHPKGICASCGCCWPPVPAIACSISSTACRTVLILLAVSSETVIPK